jgi:phosphoglycerate dehydrogenase-like enzyme
MTGFLTTQAFYDSHGAAMRQIAAETGLALEPIIIPSDPEARLGPSDLERIEGAYFSRDAWTSGLARGFFAAVHGAPNLRWLQIFFVGTDNPVYGQIIERGVTITNASGSTAVPIAQTAITGMLMLNRGFPRWMDAQRRRAWEPIHEGDVPRDLEGQQLVVLGLGAIGTEIARLGKAIGLRVTGVRRSPRKADDPVDDLVPPSRLADVLPGSDWLALACPLTDETRRIIDAAAIARMPRGAHILNVARGQVVDEAAMIEALRSGQLGGAYLDVFEKEPLPADSPLWDLPNVIITPHNSAAAQGNDERGNRIFLRNFRNFALAEEMENVVRM